MKVSNIGSKVDELSEALADMTLRVEASESQIHIISNINKKLMEQVEHLRGKQIATERILTDNCQYLRNKQVELKYFPNDIPENELKPQVSRLLSLTGVTITPDDLGKCHRLNNKNNVIVEFNDRVTRDDMLRSRKNFKNKREDLLNMKMNRVMVMESLCPDYACLDFVCRKLQKSGQLDQSWFFNGKLWVKPSENSDKLQITHITELHNMFGIEMVDEILSH